AARSPVERALKALTNRGGRTARRRQRKACEDRRLARSFFCRSSHADSSEHFRTSGWAPRSGGAPRTRTARAAQLYRSYFRAEAVAAQGSDNSSYQPNVKQFEVSGLSSSAGRADVRFSNRPFEVKRFQTFRLSTTPVSMSLAGSCFSSDSAPRPFQYGIRRRGGTIFRAALPSDQRQVQADIRTHLIHRPARDIIPPCGGARVFSC